jgi:hypothetical protein
MIVVTGRFTDAPRPKLPKLAATRARARGEGVRMFANVRSDGGVFAELSRLEGDQGLSCALIRQDEPQMGGCRTGLI